MSNTFLHNILEDEVYMQQPLGYNKSCLHPDHVCKLQKSIYGLWQSLRAGLFSCEIFLISITFKESVSDQSLFIFSNEEIMAYFLVYVDDIVLTASSSEFVSTVIAKLGEEFAPKGPHNYFLGIHISDLGNA